MLQWFITLASKIAEFAVTRRSLAVMFLLLGALLTCSGWLRPPLNRDLTPLHVPLGIWKYSTHIVDAPEAVDAGQRAFSPGALTLLAIAISIVIVIQRPEAAGRVAVVLLMVAVVANAMVLLNHPLLAESLELELSARQHMSVVMMSLNENSVTVIGQARVPPISSADQANLWSAWPFRRYGTLLIALAAVAVLLACRGPLPRRLMWLALSGVAGTLIAAVVCGQRLVAEYYWAQAASLESVGHARPARTQLAWAVSVMPELGMLGRTWQLAGKIDSLESQDTPAARFLRADRCRAASEYAAAIDASRELLASHNDSLAFNRQAAQIYASAGLSEYNVGRLTAAADSFQQGFELDPYRLDCPYYLGLILARTDFAHPETARPWFRPVLNRISDRLLRADLLSSMGDLYFAAGEFAEARKYYRESLHVYDLPKEINYRGRRGLVGM